MRNECARIFVQIHADGCRWLQIARAPVREPATEQEIAQIYSDLLRFGQMLRLAGKDAGVPGAAFVVRTGEKRC
jgi:hypothetical protein